MNNDSNRNGFTLIELIVTMTTGSALMVLAIGLVHQSMSLTSLNRERADYQRTCGRLATQWRGDVHRASEAAAPSEVSLDLIDSAGDVVSYRSESGRVIRRQPLKDGQVRTEYFELNDRTVVTFRVADAPRRATMTVAAFRSAERNTPTPDDASRIDLQVISVVGRTPTLVSAAGEAGR